MDINIIGNPILKKSLKVIILPCLFNIFTPTKLAAAAIKVPFPPRQAPKDKAHQTGLRLNEVVAPIL